MVQSVQERTAAPRRPPIHNVVFKEDGKFPRDAPAVEYLLSEAHEVRKSLIFDSLQFERYT
jgi:hypothetical protein